MSSKDSIFVSDTSNPQAVLARDIVAQTQDMLDDLLALRKSKGLKQSDVAELIGVTRTAVTAFERYDGDPKLSSLVRYAMAIGARLNISVEDGALWARDELIRSRLVDVLPSTSHWQTSDSISAFISDHSNKGVLA